MRKLFFLSLTALAFSATSAQIFMSDSLRNFKKDSSLRAAIHADSTRIEAEYAKQEKWDKLFAKAQYPVIKEAEWGGIIPVSDLTEIPDPSVDYKILFEVVQGNPDSTRGKVDQSLSEVARVLNLHIAAGIPAKKIVPVLVVHGGALNAFTTNAFYKEKFKMDNPNLKLIKELENMGTKLIACGQAMAFFEIGKDALLPEVKVSLTAQTVLTSYQLKGYVLKRIQVD